MADIFLTPYVRAVWQLLGQKFSDGGRLAIYGAGAHSRWLLSVTSDLDALPIDCIVDDDPQVAELGGRPVVTPAESLGRGIDAVLLSSDWCEEGLFSRAIRTWSKDVEIIRLYEGLPVGPYEKADDREVALRIRQNGRRHDVNSRCVVIVADEPRGREAKLGCALRQAGWEPHLLYRKRPWFDPLDYFCEAEAFDHEWHALRLAMARRPLVYHMMINSDYRVAQLFLAERPGPVIVDTYDVVAGMYTDSFFKAHPSFLAQVEHERRVLEEADGLCCRSREVDWLADHLGYGLGQRLLLPDGCWNSGIASTCRRAGDGLHLVYAGHMCVDEQADDPFAAHGSKLWLSETLASAGIHFHIYPFYATGAATFDVAFARYRELESRTSFFHLHEPVAPDALVSELGRYDLAFFAYNEVAQPECIADTFTPAKFRSGSSNKIFDFLDAGLPVVHTVIPGSFQSSILAEHGALVDIGEVDSSDWPALLASLNLDELRAAAARARDANDIRGTVGHLITFYTEVARVGQDSSRGSQQKDASHVDRFDEHQPALI